MSKIKEFVAHRFEDIDHGDLETKDFQWVPILFPYNPQRNIFVITVSIVGDKGSFNIVDRNHFRKFTYCHEYSINSIYDTCGYNPLVVIIEADNVESMKRMPRHNMQFRFISIATPNNIVKRYGKNEEEFPTLGSVDPYYFLNLQKNINKIIQGDHLSKKNIERTFKQFGNWTEFVRFVPMNMSKVISIILIQPPNDKTEKQIIKNIKNDDKIIDAYKIFGECKLCLKIITKDIFEIYRFIESLFNLETRTLTKVAYCTFKENGFWFKHPVLPQLETRLNFLEKDILKYLWNNPACLDMNRNDQIAKFKTEYRGKYEGIEGIDELKLLNLFNSTENKFIYKYSRKLKQEKWFKSLLFIKSSARGKKLLKSSLENILLDVSYTYFARKHYIITGDFDFIVPIDFHDLHTFKHKVLKFLELETNVADMRAYFEMPTEKPKCLKQEEVAAIKAVLPNSKKTTYSNTPRNDIFAFYERFLRRQLVEIDDKLTAIEKQEHVPFWDILRLANSIPTVEFHIEKLLHLFIKVHVTDAELFKKKMDMMQRENALFLFEEYSPFHNPQDKMFILTTDTFESLYKFLTKFDDCTRSTTTSIIFYQGFFRPFVPALRCRPCKFPIDEKCDACSYYTLNKKELHVKTVDLSVKDYPQKAKIAISQIVVEAEKMIHLFPWSQIGNKVDTVTKLRKTVFRHLKEALRENVNMLIFPELLVPEEFLGDIVQEIKGHKIIVIAGTHLHCYEKEGEKTRYYATCPILISDGETVKEYHMQKNKKALDEEKIEKKNESIKIEEGRGVLKFINTGFGNFGVLICFDFLYDEMLKVLSQDVDILIVPSWNRGLKRFDTPIGVTNDRRLLTIISNNGFYGGSGLYAPFKNKYLRELKSKIIPRGKEKVEYFTIDVLELDRSRNKELWKISSKKLSILNKTDKLIIKKYVSPSADKLEPRYIKIPDYLR